MRTSEQVKHSLLKVYTRQEAEEILLKLDTEWNMTKDHPKTVQNERNIIGLGSPLMHSLGAIAHTAWGDSLFGNLESREIELTSPEGVQSTRIIYSQEIKDVGAFRRQNPQDSANAEKMANSSIIAFRKADLDDLRNILEVFVRNSQVPEALEQATLGRVKDAILQFEIARSIKDRGSIIDRKYSSEVGGLNSDAFANNLAQVNKDFSELSGKEKLFDIWQAMGLIEALTSKFTRESLVSVFRGVQ